MIFTILIYYIIRYMCFYIFLTSFLTFLLQLEITATQIMSQNVTVFQKLSS